MHQADLRKRAKAKLDTAADLRRVCPALTLADQNTPVSMSSASMAAMRRAS